MPPAGHRCATSQVERAGDDRHARVPAVHRRRTGRPQRTAPRTRTATRSRATSSRTVPAAGPADATAAIDAASAAFEGWRATPPAERQRIFLKAADLLEERRDEVVSMLARETGSTFGFGMFQSFFVPEPLPAGGGARVRAARAGHPVRHGRVRDGHPPAGRRRRRDRALERGADPLGALDRRAARARQHGRAQAVRVVAARPAACSGARSSPRPGCPTACSTSSRTRPARPARSATSSIEHPAVRRLNFTGSSAVGRHIAEAAGRHLKRVVLELGGYNPLIVLADADLEYAVNASAFGSFLHQGQICMSTRRIVVERSRSPTSSSRGSSRRRRASRPATRRSTTRSSGRSSTRMRSRW